MDGLIFTAPPPVPTNRKFAAPTHSTISPSHHATILSSIGPRKLAQPSKMDITPALRSSIISDLQPAQHIGPGQIPTQPSEWVTLMANDNKEQAEQMQANAELYGAFDAAARAMADALQYDVQPGISREEQCRTDAFRELKSAIDAMLSLVHIKNAQDLNAHCANVGSGFVDDQLVRIDAGHLARAWEKQVWGCTYDTDSDIDKYVEQMDVDVADLGLWAQQFDSELCGYDVFREHLFMSFAGDESVFGRMKKEEGMFGALKIKFTAPAAMHCFVPRGARGVEDIVFEFDGLAMDSGSCYGVREGSEDVEMDGCPFSSFRSSTWFWDSLQGSCVLADELCSFTRSRTNHQVHKL